MVQPTELSATQLMSLYDNLASAKDKDVKRLLGKLESARPEEKQAIARQIAKKVLLEEVPASKQNVSTERKYEFTKSSSSAASKLYRWVFRISIKSKTNIEGSLKKLAASLHDVNIVKDPASKPIFTKDQVTKLSNLTFILNAIKERAKITGPDIVLPDGLAKGEGIAVTDEARKQARRTEAQIIEEPAPKKAQPQLGQAKGVEAEQLVSAHVEAQPEVESRVADTVTAEQAAKAEAQREAQRKAQEHLERAEQAAQRAQEQAKKASEVRVLSGASTTVKGTVASITEKLGGSRREGTEQSAEEAAKGKDKQKTEAERQAQKKAEQEKEAAEKAARERELEAQTINAEAKPQVGGPSEQGEGAPPPPPPLSPSRDLFKAQPSFRVVKRQDTAKPGELGATAGKDQKVSHKPQPTPTLTPEEQTKIGLQAKALNAAKKVHNFQDLKGLTTPLKDLPNEEKLRLLKIALESKDSKAESIAADIIDVFPGFRAAMSGESELIKRCDQIVANAKEKAEQAEKDRATAEAAEQAKEAEKRAAQQAARKAAASTTGGAKPQLTSQASQANVMAGVQATRKLKEIRKGDMNELSELIKNKDMFNALKPAEKTEILHIAIQKAVPEKEPSKNQILKHWPKEHLLSKIDTTGWADKENEVLAALQEAAKPKQRQKPVFTAEPQAPATSTLPSADQAPSKDGEQGSYDVPEAPPFDAPPR